MLSLRLLLRRHPWQFVLMVLGIALGVSVVVSIDLANASARRAFALSTDAVAGKATHQIVSASPAGLDEALYVTLRTEPRWRERIQSAPVVSEYLTSPALGEASFTLLGLDPLAEPPFRTYFGEEGQTLSLPLLAALLIRPDAVLLSADVAARHDLLPCAAGEETDACRLELEILGRSRTVYLAGVLTPGDDFSRRALETLVIADIGTAQELLGRPGHLTRIDLIVPDEAARAALEADLPPGVRLLATDTRNASVQQMTSAFGVNLTALSLLALLVGIFLIYNTMTFSVVQRRPLFGTLRCLGYTRAQVFGTVMGEAALVGALGASLGVLLGVLLGQGAVRLVTRTINDLFFVLDVRGVQMPLSSLLKGGAMGFLVTLASAAPPAWEAASVPPRLALSRSSVETRAETAVRMAALFGSGLTAGGAALLGWGSPDLVTGFVGTFAVIVGMSMLTPLATGVFIRLAGFPLRLFGGLLGQMAARNVVRSRSRTSVALAALMIAVSVTIGVQVMVSSFRTTVSLWLEETLQGDIYLSVSSPHFSERKVPLPPEVLSLLPALPEVEQSVFLRSIVLDAPQGSVEVTAVSDYSRTSPEIFLAAEGTPPEMWRAMQQGAVTVSEPLANWWGLSLRGERVSLLTPGGWREFPVAGVFSDYASTRGSIRMSLDVYRSLWGDPEVTGAVLYLHPGADADAVTERLRALLAAHPEVRVRPSSALRQGALEIFDQTFAITRAMQLLTTLVAFVGVLSALLALELDKQRELGILRALGLTRREMRRLVWWETGLMGASAGILAQPAGYALAWILIFIINRRSFGWTLNLYTPLAPLVQGFSLAVVAALLAGVYPAIHLGRMVTAEALRSE